MQAAPRSDELYQALFIARESYPQIVESFMVLSFLPMLHHTVRRVAKRQTTLSTDDIAQQTISIFLEFLRSEQLHARTSYFAFAISRAVKRQVFEWANREGEQNGLLKPESSLQQPGPLKTLYGPMDFGGTQSQLVRHHGHSWARARVKIEFQSHDNVLRLEIHAFTLYSRFANSEWFLGA